ncbi:hypothetical protein AB4037_14010 [Labrys sp. KB_33_2]|uniref:hypothetical protein n=1 Tax=Labrys sp. KB_33_2 TaxID=3237479 RepID=UPI003F91E921
MVDIQKDFRILPVQSLSPGDLVCFSGKEKEIIGFVIDWHNNKREIAVLHDQGRPELGVYLGYYEWLPKNCCVSYGKDWFIQINNSVPRIKRRDVNWLTPGVIAIGENLQTICIAPRPQDPHTVEAAIDLKLSKPTTAQFGFDDHVLIDEWEVWLKSEAAKGDGGKPLLSFRHSRETQQKP